MSQTTEGIFTKSLQSNIFIKSVVQLYSFYWTTGTPNIVDLEKEKYEFTHFFFLGLLLQWDIFLCDILTLEAHDNAIGKWSLEQFSIFPILVYALETETHLSSPLPLRIDGAYFSSS